MADPITDERLRCTANLSFRLHDDEVRAIAAELLAARARIAKLEQEPPMAMIDFGVGVNWKGLHEDMQRLRAERDAARAEVAEARRLDGVRLSQIASLQEIIRNDTTPAGVEVARFRAEVERLRAEAAKCDALRARVAVLEWGLAQLVLEGEDAAFDPLQDRLQRCGIMPTQAALDAAKDPNQ